MPLDTEKHAGEDHRNGVEPSESLHEPSETTGQLPIGGSYLDTERGSQRDAGDSLTRGFHNARSQALPAVTTLPERKNPTTVILERS